MLQGAPTANTQDHNGFSKNAATAERPLGRPLMPALRARTSRLKFFASSSNPNPEDRRQSHQAWEKDYLNDLRSNRPVRPSGARPPSNQSASLGEPTPETPLRAPSAMTFRPSISLRQTSPTRLREENRCSSALSYQQEGSRTSASAPTATDNNQPLNARAISTIKGRPVAQETLKGDGARETPPAARTSSGMYKEREQRLVEKEEARMLREALEFVDLKEEARLHSAAQAEASELVWKHQNHGASRKDSDTPYLYKQQLWNVGHGRSQSDVPTTASAMTGDDRERIKKSASERPDVGYIDDTLEVLPAKRQNEALRVQERSLESNQQNDPSPCFDQRNSSSGKGRNQLTNSHALWDSPQKKAYINLSFSLPQVKSSGRRRSSGAKTRTPSGSLFRNPDDKIYEEPEEMGRKPDLLEAAQGVDPVPLRSMTRNLATKTQPIHQPYLRSMTDPIESKGKYSRTETHRNPPSQSWNPSYQQNESLPTPPDQAKDNNYKTSKDGTKNAVEIRSDDIRAATSMRLKDRSPKLPSPTVVSNAKRRPIVSFDRNWTPTKSDTKLQESLPQRPPSQDEACQLPATVRSKPPPESTVSAPAIPTINVPEPPSIKIDEAPSLPSISVSTVPSISVSAEETSSASSALKPKPSTPLPTFSKGAMSRLSGRPLPHHSSTAPAHMSVPHWSPSQRRATAQCAACALPISGRIVSASSQRFHPECFTCYHCSEQLECVAFYPEPDAFRRDRIARIRARAEGAEVPDESGKTWEDDGDESLRFYCHLDFHEKFSPRCRSCKTPIEGEVVVACGGEWHVGHFFCAQCGDPFDQKTPFVEKDGYAWCVGCHTNRFSGKCRGCKKPVVDLVVRALGGEWHDGCFCCKECDGSFEDGRFFTRGDDEVPVCVKCEERRLKA